MIAPSEKHLEDWIVANFKKFGDLWEDDSDYGDLAYYPDDKHVLWPFSERIIARQLQLPSGYPDLIVADENHVSVVELKKGAVTYDTLGQCLRYIHDMYQIFWHVWADAAGSDNPDHHAYRYTPIKSFEHIEYPQDEITGIVVGSSIADKNLVLVAATCGIQVITYRYQNNEYLFTHEMMNSNGSYNAYQSFVNSGLGVAMRRVMQTRSERQREQEASE
jgi:hypothetical protein